MKTSLRIFGVILVICLMVFIGACNGDKPIEKPIVETDTGGTDTGGGVGKMYWTDEDTNEIFRANLDGSNAVALGSAVVPLGAIFGEIDSMALDMSGGS